MTDQNPDTKTILKASDIDKVSKDELIAVANEWDVSTSGSKKEIGKRIIEAQKAADGPVDVDPLPDVSLDDGLSPPERKKDRVEKYERVAPDGNVVTVTHNIDTGEISVDR